MNRRDAKAYQRRWQKVAAAERAALRRMSMAEKLDQLAKLMESGPALGRDPHREAEVEKVRQRWRRLRALVQK
jgi:hypothetical protein